MNTDAFKQLIPILTLIIIKMLPKMNNSIFLCSKLIIHFCQVVTHNTKQNIDYFCTRNYYILVCNCFNSKTIPVQTPPPPITKLTSSQNVHRSLNRV